MPISSLTNQYISSSFQYLMQVSSSGEIFDGAGNQINSLKVTSLTGSVSGIMASASFATTASYISPTFISASAAASGFGASAVTLGSNTFTGTQTINGNVVITGTATALQYVVSSSVYYVTTSYMSGSTKFGDTQDDTHQFTGSLNLSGSHSGILPNLYHYGINQYSDNSLNASFGKRWYTTPFLFQTFTGVGFSANCIYTSPFVVNETRTAAQLGVRVTNVTYSNNTGSIALGIYKSTSNVYPENIVVSCSAFEVYQAGIYFVSSSIASTRLDPGLYWLAVFISGSIMSDSVNFQYIGGNYTSNYSYPVNLLGYTFNDPGTNAVPVGLVYAGVTESFSSGFPITFPTSSAVNIVNQMPWIGVYFSA